ncbi:hypothetical protein ABIF70_005204 [Bradyrhizobium japonicum]
MSVSLWSKEHQRMAGAGLQKYFTDVARLHVHPFFNKTGLTDDLATGEVFPAIRKNEVHFYHGGARLCVYKDGHAYTNNRYLELPDDGRSRDVRIPAERFTPADYETIKGKCKSWRTPERELSIVSELFPVFSIAASHLPADRARLLDIECRFPGAAEGETAQDMIDCLFLAPDGTLVFVEVKRTDNPEARGSGQSEPAVAGQLRRYRQQLGSEGLCNEVTDVYTGVSDALGLILGRQLPLPRTVLKKVPLLIVGPTAASSPRAKEVWQQTLLASPLSLDGDIIVIDGRNERMIAALDELFLALNVNEAAGQ